MVQAGCTNFFNRERTRPVDFNRETDTFNLGTKRAAAPFAATSIEVSDAPNGPPIAAPKASAFGAQGRVQGLCVHHSARGESQNHSGARMALA